MRPIFSEEEEEDNYFGTDKDEKKDDYFD